MTPQNHSEERRQFVRVDMRLTVTYAIVGTQKLGRSLTKDLGGGGIRFLAEHQLEPGTQLKVTMRVPERHEPVEFLGEVVWSKNASLTDVLHRSAHGSTTEVGVRFVQVDPKDRALIQQYAAFHRPRG